MSLQISQGKRATEGTRLSATGQTDQFSFNNGLNNASERKTTGAYKNNKIKKLKQAF